MKIDRSKLRSIYEKYLRCRNFVKFYFSHNSFHKKGKNNIIKYNSTCRFENCKITIKGNNNKVIFGNNSAFCGLEILVEEDNNIIEFGEHVIVHASKMQHTVITTLGGRKITVGDNSLLSNNIEIHTTDYHGIYDKNGNLINENRDITIGKHVWVGLGCKIMKGTSIKDGSIVGAGSLVTGKFDEENILLAGIPAKIIRHQVFWDADRKLECTVPMILKEKWEDR